MSMDLKIRHDETITIKYFEYRNPGRVPNTDTNHNVTPEQCDFAA